jgi:hypothetical protein
LLLGVGSIALLRRRAAPTRYQVAALWFAVLFPALYVIAKRSPLYDTARQMMFLYPPFAALAASAGAALWNAERNWRTTTRIAFGCLGLAMIEPISFHIAHHPNQNVYFNALVGGPEGAFGRYEMDYWGNSIRQAVAWVHENGHEACGPMLRITFAEPLQYFASLETLRYDDTFFVEDRRRACFSIDPVADEPAPFGGQRAASDVVHAISVGTVPLYWIRRGGALGF